MLPFKNQTPTGITMKLIAALLIASSPITSAIAAPTDYIEIGYTKLKIDGISAIKPSGYGFTLNKGFKNLYFTAGYHTSDDSFKNSNSYEDGYYKQSENNNTTITFSQTEIGLGKIFKISETSNIDVIGYYTKFKVKSKMSGNYSYEDTSGNRENWSYSDKESDSASVYTVEAVHDKIFGKINTRIGLGFERFQDEESENNLIYLAEIGYAFTDNISTNVKYRNADEYRTLSAYIKYNF